MEPEVGLSRHPIMFINVDLPEPDGPMMAIKSPVLIFKSTPSRALIVDEPLPKVFVSLVISTMIDIIYF
jgi:hypothetical protein